MSEIKVNKISQRSGTAITLGNSGTDFQLPSGADIVAQSGSTITIAAGATITNSGTATGFGATGAVNWDTTKKTTGFTAVSGIGYFCDTTSAAFTVTLPLSPSAGAIIALSDYAGTWSTNNITIGRNSSNINGSATNLTLNTNDTTATLIYVDATEGWRVIDTGSLSSLYTAPLFVAATGGTITTCGDYKIHSFTGPGTFTVTCAGNAVGSNKADVLIVSGGGGGGGDLAGGGGGGGLVFIPSANNSALSATAYPISIGGGGNGGPGSPAAGGSSGTNSTGFSLTAVGGGGGSAAGAPPAGIAGVPGGSGGGASGGSNPVIGAGGTATQPTQPGNSGTYGFGSAGGNRTPTGQAFNGGGAGGGGGNSVGSNQPGTGPGGPGGSGKDVTPVFGASPKAFYGPTNGFYSGGGGAGANPGGPGGCGGTGGPGGGGAGGAFAVGGSAGTTNTGGGGGGGGASGGAGAGGGSGIVLIRYKFQ